MKASLLLTIVAGLLTSAAALAQSPPASSPSPERAEKGQRQFSKMDKNGDGMISREEAAGHQRLLKRFDQIDSSKDGKLSKEELQASRAAMREKHKKHKGKFDEKFKAADKDGDGALTKAEAENGKLRRIARGFDKIDANKDGKVTPDELRAHIQSKHKDRAKPN